LSNLSSSNNLSQIIGGIRNSSYNQRVGLESTNNIYKTPDVVLSKAGIPLKNLSFDKILSETREKLPVNSEKWVVEDAIDKAHNQTKIDKDLIRAIIKTESGFNINATSKTGAQGLMQLMPETAKALNVTNPFDPHQNVSAGSKYLADLIFQFKGDLHLALAAYNAGPGAVQKYKGVPPFNETKNYIDKVLKAYNDFSNKSTINKNAPKLNINRMGDLYA